MEVWLEGASNCELPPDFYASLRPGEVLAAPMRCTPHEASCLGGVGTNSGPAFVDIFQRVGTINLELLEPGAPKDSTIMWPGCPQLSLRIIIKATDLGASNFKEAEKHSAMQTVLATPNASKEHFAPPKVVLQSKQHSVLEQVVNMQKSMSIVCPMSPNLPEEELKIYKPMVLKNCDQIIPHLYLGGLEAVSDMQSLVQQDIRAVCCCLRELELPSTEFCQDLEYYRVDVEDMGREPIELFFLEATEFIHSWVSREQHVLVHCRAGVSRSVTIVIAYLVRYYGYSLYDAFFLVRSHRSVATPNIGFMEKLGDYEEANRGTDPTIEINKYANWFSTPERAAVPNLNPFED